MNRRKFFKSPILALFGLGGAATTAEAKKPECKVELGIPTKLSAGDPHSQSVDVWEKLPNGNMIPAPPFVQHVDVEEGVLAYHPVELCDTVIRKTKKESKTDIFGYKRNHGHLVGHPESNGTILWGPERFIMDDSGNPLTELKYGNFYLKWKRR